MARRVLVGCVLLLCGVLTGCSDATAPEGRLLIVVSPDTLHFGQSVTPPLITYRERFVALGEAKLWVGMPLLEAEVTPGKWESQQVGDPNNQYLQPALGDASTLFTESDLGGEKSLFLRLVGGRYRIRQQYQVTAPGVTQPTGEVLVATSNPFVVTF